MQKRNTFVIIAILAISALLLVPVNAWVYPDGTEDTKYELFGPRLDRIFIDMYSTEDLMWTALKDGKIDVTDWPLSKTWYAEFIKPEYAGKIKICFAGGEAGYYIVEFNHNTDPLLAPGVPNPILTPEMKKNPMAGNETDDGGRSGLSLRRALIHLWDRTKFTDIFLGAMGEHMYTPVPTYMGGYVHPDIKPGRPLEAFCYLYNRTKASEILNASLYKMGPDGWRYFDINDNNVKEAGEELKPIFNYRSDHAGRRTIGEMLVEEMRAEGIKINVQAFPLSAMDNYIKSMLENNFHMSTFGWINMGPDPDYLHDLYTGAGSWYDPTSSCNNEGYLSDPILNELGKKIKYANTFDEAKEAALDFQERFAFLAAQMPNYCNVAYKAHSVKYVGDGTAVGPEDTYEGENWKDIVNQMGFGTNSWWTFLNAHPETHEYGDGSHMTIRYGWKVKGYPQHINPLYAEWYWDHEVLNKIYDSLGFRDPYDLSVWKPWMVTKWEEGTWTHPVTGETLTKVKLTLRPDITWSDGVPFSMADVVFTLVESTPMLLARGYPPPWYYPQVETIKSWTVIDAFNIELLLNVKSVFAVGWILGGEYVIPKHIWYPIISSGNPAAFQPDPTCTGTGPFKFVSHAPDVSVVLEKNPTCFQYYPVRVTVESPAKIILPHDTATVDNTFGIKIENLWLNQCNGGFLEAEKFVFLNNELLEGFPKNVTLVTLPNGTIVPDIEEIPLTLTKCRHELKVAVHIKGPADLDALHTNPWISNWVNVTFTFWVTCLEDIGGTYFDPFNEPPEVPVPDCIVDISDIYAAALAYGAYPGHPRWNSICDIAPVPHDYWVDIGDIYVIALAFGQPKP
jgi:ABC-type transport system substrate-binding protein